MFIYKVKSNLKYNGTLYKLNDDVELSEKIGKKLVADGVVELVKNKTSNPKDDLEKAEKDKKKEEKLKAKQIKLEKKEKQEKIEKDKIEKEEKEKLGKE